MKRKNAFTLVELLVVISIIALLLAILVPALNRAREFAKRIVCVSLLKSYAMANITYAAACDGWLVPFSQKYFGSDPAHTWGERWCENKLYRKNLSVNARVQITDSGWNDAFKYPTELRCPSHIIKDPCQYVRLFSSTESSEVIMSYGYNAEQWRFNSGNLTMNATWYPYEEYCANRLSDVRRPASVMMFIDSTYYQVRYIKANHKEYWDLPESGDSQMIGGNTLTAYNKGMVAYRHNDGADLAYFDGHCGYLKKKDVWMDGNNDWLTLSNVRKRMANTLWDVKTSDLQPPR